MIASLGIDGWLALSTSDEASGGDGNSGCCGGCICGGSACGSNGGSNGGCAGRANPVAWIPLASSSSTIPVSSPLPASLGRSLGQGGEGRGEKGSVEGGMAVSVACADGGGKQQHANLSSPSHGSSGLMPSQSHHTVSCVHRGLSGNEVFPAAVYCI